jgi:2',3'-cyclic-nucleotide 2'-phosphodiesterase (5'-nucleotidase family)
VLRSEAQVVNLYDDPRPEHANEAVQAICAALLEKSAVAMDEVVGRFTGPLERGHSAYHSGPAGNLIADVMRARGKADVAIHNRGGIRDDVAAGAVTRRDLFRVLPFDNHLVTLVLSGAQLEALMRRSIEGERRSGLEFSGMTIELTRGAEHPIMGAIRVGGALLQPRKRYRVTTNNFLATGGDAYREFAHAEERETDPILQRDLLEEALRAGPLTPSVENRYVLR